jgi:hypothetical protein
MQNPEGVTSLNILRSVYCVNFHSHLRYYFILDGEVNKMHLLKEMFRLIIHVERATSCKELFKTLNLKPMPHGTWNKI